MNPAKLCLCLWALLASIDLFAQNCTQSHPNDQLECSGTFKATTIAELDSYKNDLGINSAGTKIKHLKIDFDYNGGALDLYTPCRLIVENARQITVNGDACLVGKDETRIDNGASFSATGDVRLESENVVVLQANASVDIGGNFEMVATGSAGDARANIRNNASLNIGGDFLLRALRQAQVGHEVSATIGGGFTIISNGETLPSEDSDWSSLGRDSTITANDLSIAAHEKVNIGANTIINTNSIYLNALDCKIRNGAQINSPTKTGNCFSGEHPTAKFKTTPLGGGDAPLELFLNGDKSSTPTGSIIAYHWEFVGMGTITTTIPTTYYAFNEPGIYKIRLQVENDQGLKNTVSKKIVVTGGDNQPPVASFSLSATDILVGESVTVDGSASSDDYRLKRYHWTLSNGSSLTTRNPISSFNFNEVGAVDITLVVEDALGLMSTPVTQTVNVEADSNGVAPKAYFNASPFSDFSGIDLFNRSIAGDGAITEIYYLIDGVRIDSPDFTYGSRIVLPGFPHNGSHDITIFVTDDLGNTSSFQKTVVMDSTIKPVVLFDLVQSDALTAYVKAIDSYDPLFDISSISIDWGDGTVQNVDPTNLYLTHTYAQAGDYNATLSITTGRGESNALTKTISVSDTAVPAIDPTALFEVLADPALGHVRLYVSQSGTPNGAITGYSWQMGDGNVIEGLDQVAYFYDQGIYDITLTITDEAGLSASQTQTIMVNENGDPLIIRAECQTGSNNSVGCFTQVGHRFAQLSNLQIDWGDGSIENIAPNNPYFSVYEALTHQYTQAGNYTITFYATAANGDEQTITRDVSFSSDNMRPIGNINCSTDAMTITCNATGSYDPDGFITNYEYEVAPGVTVFSQDGVMTYTYQTPGLYDVSLVAFDQFGLDSIPVTTQVSVAPINQPPTAVLNCYSDTTFRASCDAEQSFDPDQGIQLYEYTFYDDTVQTVVNFGPQRINYDFASGGLKRIDLTVTDLFGLSSTTTVNLDVQDNVPPVAAFTCSSTISGQVDCDGSSSSDSDGTIANYNWTIGGVSYQGSQVSATGISGTSTTVQLQVTDNSGAIDIATDNNVFVKQVQPPIAVASCTETDILTISCSGSGSSDPDNQALSYSWSFSDGGNISGETVSYKFSSNTGPYSATLTVTDEDGAVGTQSVSVNPIPAPAPTVAFSCSQSSNLTLVCSSTTTEPHGTIENYFWDIDGQSYQGQSVTVEFSQAVTSSVNLTVNSSTGTIATGTAQSYSITDDGSGVGVSEVIASIQGVSEESFNPISENLVVDLSNGDLSYEQDGSVSYLLVIFNDEEIPQNDLDVIGGQFIIDRSPLDGMNELAISFKDDQGKRFYQYYRFLAGSNEINISFEDSTGSTFSGTPSTTVFMSDYSSIKINSTSTSFTNVPTGNLQLVSHDTSGFYGAENLNIDQSLVTSIISMFDVGSITATSSIDFEGSLDGFEVFEGTAQGVQHDNSTSIIDYSGNEYELIINPSAEDKLVLGGRFNISSQGSVMIPLSINAKSVNDTQTVVVKNLTTGSLDIHYIDASSLGYREDEGEKLLTAGEIFLPVGLSEVFLFGKFEDVSRTSSNRETGNTVVLPDRLIPNDVPIISEINLRNTIPFVSNLAQDSVDRNLAGFSFGRPIIFNENGVSLHEHFIENGVFKNEIEVELHTNIPILFNSTYQLSLKIGENSGIILDTPSEYLGIFNNKHVTRFRIDISDLTSTNSVETAKVIMTDLTLSGVLYPFSIENKSPFGRGDLYFPVTIHLNDNLIDRSPTSFDNGKHKYWFGNENNLYESLDLEDGYATWVSPKYQNYYNTINLDDRFRINDLSYINSFPIRRLKDGSESTNGSHQFGTDFDLNFSGSDSFSNGVSSLSQAEKFEDVLNIIGKDARWVTITELNGSGGIDSSNTIHENKYNTDTDFRGHVNATCLASGLDMREVVRVDRGHQDHVHLSLYSEYNLDIQNEIIKLRPNPSQYTSMNIADNGNGGFDLNLGSFNVDSTLRVFNNGSNQYYYRRVLIDSLVNSGTTPSNSIINSIFYKFKQKEESGGVCTKNCYEISNSSIDFSNTNRWHRAKVEGADFNVDGEPIEAFKSGNEILVYARVYTGAGENVENNYSFRIKRRINNYYCAKQDQDIAVDPDLNTGVFDSLALDKDTGLNVLRYYYLNTYTPVVKVIRKDESLVTEIDNTNVSVFTLNWNFYDQDLAINEYNPSNALGSAIGLNIPYQTLFLEAKTYYATLSVVDNVKNTTFETQKIVITINCEENQLAPNCECDGGTSAFKVFRNTYTVLDPNTFQCVTGTVSFGDVYMNGFNSTTSINYHLRSDVIPLVQVKRPYEDFPEPITQLNESEFEISWEYYNIDLPLELYESLSPLAVSSQIDPELGQLLDKGQYYAVLQVTDIETGIEIGKRKVEFEISCGAGQVGDDCQCPLASGSSVSVTIDNSGQCEYGTPQLVSLIEEEEFNNGFDLPECIAPQNLYPRSGTCKLVVTCDYGHSINSTFKIVNNSYRCITEEWNWYRETGYLDDFQDACGGHATVNHKCSLSNGALEGPIPTP